MSTLFELLLCVVCYPFFYVVRGLVLLSKAIFVVVRIVLVIALFLGIAKLVKMLPANYQTVFMIAKSIFLVCFLILYAWKPYRIDSFCDILHLRKVR